MKKFLFLVPALFLVHLVPLAGPVSADDSWARSLMKPVNSAACIRYLRDMGDSATLRLEPGAEYIQIAAFTSIREAHQSYWRMSGHRYNRTLFVRGDGYIRLLLGPYADPEDYLWRYRQRLSPGAFIVYGSDAPVRWRESNRTYDGSVITKLQPDLEYLVVGTYSNEADARLSFDGRLAMLYERKVFLAGDGRIRLLFGPFASADGMLAEIRGRIAPDATILSTSRTPLFPVPEGVNHVLNRHLVQGIRNSSRIILNTGLTPPDITGGYSADWINPAVPAALGYTTNCSIVISEQKPDGTVNVSLDPVKFPFVMDQPRSISGFVSGSGDNFTLYIPWSRHTAVAWEHGIILMSGNKIPNGNIGNFRLTGVIGEKKDPLKEFGELNRPVDLTELDGALVLTQPGAAPAAPAVSSAPAGP